MNENYGMEKVHEANLLILKEIDRICRKYKIKYVLDSGTLLGAVRHKGFIPWDDDVDLAFSRNDYEAFCKVVSRELPDTMEFVDYRKFHGGKGFYDFTSRIIYKKSRRNGDSPEMDFYDGKLNHLWVDLFVRDRLPERKFAAKTVKFLQALLYGFAMGHRYDLDMKKYSMKQKMAVGFLAGIGKMLPLQLIFKLQRRLSIMTVRCKTRYCYYSNYQPDYLYVTLERKWCEETVDLEFADTRLMAPKEWHEVLTWIYGDYMKLPPKDQRVPSHSGLEIQVYE